MSILRPDYYYTNVHSVDLRMLADRGVEALLVDLDNTLLPRDSKDLPTQVVEWSDATRDAGFRVCLVSNNWHERVRAVAEPLGFALVAKALKPLPFAFRRALTLLDATPSRAAVIGDQLFTDVLGGNLVGATTVLVQPQSRTDLPHTLLLRKLEALIMAGREPSGRL